MKYQYIPELRIGKRWKITSIWLCTKTPGKCDPGVRAIPGFLTSDRSISG